MRSSIVRVKALTRCVALVSFALVLALTGGIAKAQALTVSPVNIQILPGQKATILTVVNRGDSPTSIQVRAYAWAQSNGGDQLTTSDVMLVGPPLATISPGASQVIRLVLRRSSAEREDTYRIILDQIPSPSAPGVIHVVLRMSIPVFAQPKLRAGSRVQFHLERGATQLYLVATNDGVVHESLHNIDLWTENGLKLKTEFDGSQYILAGATRRWPLVAQDPALHSFETLHLTATGLNGSIRQQVPLVDMP